MVFSLLVLHFLLLVSLVCVSVNVAGVSPPGAVLGSWSGSMNHPLSLFIDNDDRLWIADTGNNRILLWTWSSALGTYVTSNSFSNSNILISPSAVAVDSSYNMYIADTGYGSIWIGTYNGDETYRWATGVAVGISLDSSRNLYVVDNTVGKIVVYSNTGTSLTSYSYSPYTPLAVFVNAEGIIYATTSHNQVIAKNYQGSIVYGPYTAGLNQPMGITQDIATGTIYVSDTGNNRIVALAKDGTFLSAFSDSLSSPGGISLDIYGNVYVADSGNNRVVAFEGYHLHSSSSSSSSSSSTSSPLPLLSSSSSTAQTAVGITGTQNISPSSSSTSFPMAEIIGLAAGGGGLVLLFLLCVCCYCVRKRRSSASINKSDKETIKHQPIPETVIELGEPQPLKKQKKKKQSISTEKTASTPATAYTMSPSPTSQSDRPSVYEAEYTTSNNSVGSPPVSPAVLAPSPPPYSSNTVSFGGSLFYQEVSRMLGISSYEQLKPILSSLGNNNDLFNVLLAGVQSSHASGSVCASCHMVNTLYSGIINKYMTSRSQYGASTAALMAIQEMDDAVALANSVTAHITTHNRETAQYIFIAYQVLVQQTLSKRT